MCEHMVEADSVTTMLGVMSCLYDGRPKDASLLMDLYARDCKSKGAVDGCVLSSLLHAQVYITMTLLGDEGEPRVNDLTMWWAEQCRN